MFADEHHAIAHYNMHNPRVRPLTIESERSDSDWDPRTRLVYVAVANPPYGLVRRIARLARCKARRAARAKLRFLCTHSASATMSSRGCRTQRSPSRKRSRAAQAFARVSGNALSTLGADARATRAVAGLTVNELCGLPKETVVYVRPAFGGRRNKRRTRRRSRSDRTRRRRRRTRPRRRRRTRARR